MANIKRVTANGGRKHPSARATSTSKSSPSKPANKAVAQASPNRGTHTAPSREERAQIDAQSATERSSELPQIATFLLRLKHEASKKLISNWK